MAMDKIGDGLKKILLVGIGAAATTVEKSSQIIDELVKKGEITVEQGKELNKQGTAAQCEEDDGSPQA